jgi:uncharacterized protein (UPF0332 family)
MSIKEQSEIKTLYYNEAIRYMDNAKDVLKKAGKKDEFYKDDKYVKMSCGTAYNGVLKALDGYLLLKNVEKRKGRKSIEYYQQSVSKVDKKLLNYLNSAYQILHLDGYYDGIKSVKAIQVGFDLAYTVIEKIKP